MNKCTKCGVELDIEMNYCPLCGQKSSLQVDTHRETKTVQMSTNTNSKQTYDLNELTQPQKRKLFWELSGIILVSGTIVSYIIDLIINKQISWSKYTITIGLFIIVNISLITFWHKKVVMLLLSSFISTSLLLLMLDLFHQNLGWGLKLGIPIIFFVYVILFVLILAIKQSKQKGINIIAYILIAASLLCVSIESIISLHLIDHLRLRWSIILLTSVLSVSVILLFIHFRLKKATDLKKFFHI